MRLTTKIFLGLLTTIFSLTAIFTVYLSIAGDRQHRGYMADNDYLSQDFTEISIPSHKVVVIENTNIYTSESKLYVHQSKEKTNKLSFPKELAEQLKTTMVGDTLKLMFTLQSEFGRVSGFNLNLYSEEGNLDIISYNNGLGITLEGVKSDNTTLFAHSGIAVNASEIKTLTIDGKRTSVTLNDSKVDVLNINLDEVNQRINNSYVLTENLTGRGSHRIDISESKAKTINWHPKDSTSELHLSLPGDTTSIVFQ